VKPTPSQIEWNTLPQKNRRQDPLLCPCGRTAHRRVGPVGYCELHTELAFEHCKLVGSPFEPGVLVVIQRKVSELRGRA
jgi:hypothetical protein